MHTARLTLLAAAIASVLPAYSSDSDSTVPDHHAAPGDSGLPATASDPIDSPLEPVDQSGENTLEAADTETVDCPKGGRAVQTRLYTLSDVGRDITLFDCGVDGRTIDGRWTRAVLDVRRQDRRSHGRPDSDIFRQFKHFEGR